MVIWNEELFFNLMAKALEAESISVENTPRVALAYTVPLKYLNID